MTRDAMGELTTGLGTTAIAPTAKGGLVASPGETITRTSALVAQLKEMASQAGEALFRRAGLAMEVLSDREWIAAPPFNGSRGLAEDTLAADCFPDASLIPGGFAKILILRRFFPDVAKWREHKFNVVKLWIEYEKANIKPPPIANPHPPVPPAMGYKEKYEGKEKEAEELGYKLKKQEQQTQAAKKEVEQVRQQFQTEKQRLAELGGRVGELEARLGLQNEEIARLKGTIAEKNDWIKAQDDRIAELEAEIDRLKQSEGGGKKKTKAD